MTRAFLVVLDSLGIGAAADAAGYGDAGADTLGHVVEACRPRLPNLARLGLFHAAALSRGAEPPPARPGGAWGYAVEESRGKDTPSGHWELCGVPVRFDWGYFPPGPPSFPAALTDALAAEGGVPGFLGNCQASGTEIIELLGAEHIASGKPILYTSADSVLQIAAHEAHFGLDRLLALCAVARRLADRWDIGRVIARPFVGAPGSFRRTQNRRDLAVPPPAPTLLDVAAAAGREVVGIGKIKDIFAGRGVTRHVSAGDDAKGLAALDAAAAEAPAGALVVANLNDLDTLFGHRRDPRGYAGALARIDAALPALERRLRPGDVVVAAADHGCDPTFRGTDHTREHVPVLAFGPAVAPRLLGRRRFADVGQSLAAHLGLAPLGEGDPFL